MFEACNWTRVCNMGNVGIIGALDEAESGSIVCYVLHTD